MTAAEAWNLALAAIAAATGVAAVVFWLVDRSRRKREAPVAELRVTSVKFMDPGYRRKPGREYGHITVANHGDADARALEVMVDERSFHIEDGHADLLLASLAAGATVRIPVSWPVDTAPSGTIIWVYGPGASVKVGECTVRWGALPEEPLGADE